MVLDRSKRSEGSTATFSSVSDRDPQVDCTLGHAIVGVLPGFKWTRDPASGSTNTVVPPMSRNARLPMCKGVVCYQLNV